LAFFHLTFEFNDISLTHEKDAAKAYNKAAIRYFGDFACLNDIS